MTHTYNITGMTCGSCAAKVKSELLKLGDVLSADVQLTAPQATITMQRHLPTTALQSALRQAGAYTISDADTSMHDVDDAESTDEVKPWFDTYKPILLIFGYVLLVAVIAGFADGSLNWMTAMRVFMSGFFLSFSFFKLLDLNGFADSYATYDVVANRFRAWGFIYPFVELALGLAFALNVQPVATNAVTLLVMSVSLVGVVKSLLSKTTIRCACLGAVFNLRMNTVTVVEDALMIAMSGAMLLLL